MARNNKWHRYRSDEKCRKQLRRPLLRLMEVIETDPVLDRWASGYYIAEKLAQKMRYSHSGWFNTLVGSLLYQLSLEGLLEIRPANWKGAGGPLFSPEEASYRLSNALERIARV